MDSHIKTADPKEERLRAMVWSFTIKQFLLTFGFLSVKRWLAEWVRQ